MEDLSEKTSSSEAAKSESLDKPTQKTVVSALEAVHLDVDYWLETLKTECGVTEYGQLRFIDNKNATFKKLKKSIRHDWEKRALKELLGLESTSKEEKKEREIEAKKLISELKSLRDEGKDRTDKLVKEKLECLREMQNKPKEDWNQSEDGASLDQIISEFEDIFGKPGQRVFDRHDLSDSELLEKASGGLAMKGILIKNEKDCSQVRRVVIEVPRHAILKAPISKQQEHVFTSTSRVQSDHFQNSLDNMGHSVAASVIARYGGIGAETGVAEKQEEEGNTELESHEINKYVFREKYFYVPTAVCELDQHTLKLSETVLTELGKLELLIEGTDSEIAIQDKCEAFLETYGSHINVGTFEFGGIYEWIATYYSKSKVKYETLKTMVQDALTSFVSMSYSSLGISAGGSISGDQVGGHANITETANKSELSKVSLKLTTKGGPQEVSGFFPDWKTGLLQNNSTWSIINRGHDFRKDFVGIWQLIHNHTNHFRNGDKLAQTLQHTWRLMKDKVLDPTESLNSFLKQIPEWSSDDKLSSHATEYLQKLSSQVEETPTEAMESKYWVEVLNNDKHISEFLMGIVNLERQYTSDDLPKIKYLLRKLVYSAGQNDFPNRNKILDWVEICPTNEYLPSILRPVPPKDIPSLIEAVKDKLLPAMETAHVKARAAGKMGDEIDRKATVDLALAVDQLRTQMENSGKQYEPFLLLSALRELSFDPARKSFNVLLTKDRLRKFIQGMENTWKEFDLFRNIGGIKQQAYLIRLLVSSVSEIDSPLHKEHQFTEALKTLQHHLTPEINVVLEQFATRTPYDWIKLSTTLRKLEKGNKVLQSPAVGIPDLEEITNQNLPTDSLKDETLKCAATNEETPAGKLLKKLGLIKYYPCKISLQDVMAIGDSPQEHEFLFTDLPWIILQKLIMLDNNGQDGYVGKVASGTQPSPSDNPEDNEDGAFSTSTIDDILSGFDNEEVDNVALNPLDVLIASYSCCDLTLQQKLMQKMFMCRLAVPFIFPKLADDLLKYSLWALRSIVVDWKNEGGEAIETSVVRQPTNIVSFVRLGRPGYSKSILLNNVLSDQTHHTFWNKECPQGHSTPEIANGLVQAAWFLPEGKTTDMFKNVTMFLNLRGDACEHPTQVQVLREISNVMVCCIETSDLENPEILEKLKTIHGTSSKVILLLAAKEIGTLKPMILRKQLEHYVTQIGKEHMANTKQICTFRGNKEKNTDDLKHEVREVVSILLQGQQGNSIEEASLVASKAGVDIDEHDELCLKAEQLAEEVIKCMGDKSTIECKSEMLPLQGETFQEWCKLQRKEQRSGSKDIESSVIHEMAVIKQKMTHLRQKQLQDCQSLSLMMKTFLEHLIRNIDSQVAILYLQWLKLKFDDISRKNLPGSFKAARDTVGNSSKETERLQCEMEEAERVLAGASLGLEHLFREVSQIYEAAIESNLQLNQLTAASVERLPEVAAKLLLRGQPLEIMDGDPSNVPLTWVKAVLTSLKALVEDKRVFVVSVLGIQSSGKTRLLNTMFGLQFADRCTRGVYMQLIKVDKTKNDLQYEYVLVLDTEGLRALEMDHQKHTHDNELATLLIGLGDVTIMNFKGENVEEMKDVLQIAVHAFLRMKITNQNFQLHPTSVFIHQNVPAINAKEKTRHDCQKLQANLDEMTTEACAIENIADVHTFNQVIGFDAEKHIWYFSDLRHGDPPIAPSNPGYTEKVQACLFSDLSRKQKTFLRLSDMILRIEDLWKWVMADDFVFSFQNSLTAKAYNCLELRYYELIWTVEAGIIEWLKETAILQLQDCKKYEELESCSSRLLTELEKEVSDRKESALLQLQEFFETNNLRDIVIQWKPEKIGSLNSDTRAFGNRARQEIEQKKDNLCIDLLQKPTQGKPADVEIMNKAKQFADTLKGKDASAPELDAKFDSIWIRWLNELVPRTVTTQVTIETVVERMLWQHLSKDSPILRKELMINHLSEPLQLEMLEGSIKVGDIMETHLSVRTSIGQSISSFFKGSNPWLQCRHTAVQAVNIILRKVDLYLTDLAKQVSKFDESYATCVIKSVLDGVQEHNQQYTKEYPFTLLPNLMVKLVVHSCRHAIVMFNKMQKYYDENHSTAKKWDLWENTASNLFKDTVNQRTKEVLAADLLYDKLEEIAKNTIGSRLTSDIIDDYLIHQLPDGIYEAHKARKELKECFDFEIIEYAISRRSYFPQYNRYAELAKKLNKEISQSIENSITAATELVSQQPNADIRLWGQKFCVALTKLPVKEGDLNHMMEQDVQDFQNLKSLLMDRLLEMEKRNGKYSTDFLSGVYGEHLDEFDQ